MNIDKNNWFIREDSLTEEQYVDVCKYLVENYEKGSQYLKVLVAADNGSVDGYTKWLFVGVREGVYKNFSTYDYEDVEHPNEITYQDFLDHVKEPEWIDWEGDECPVDPETVVEIELRDGGIYRDSACMWRWSVGTFDDTPAKDIVKYRILPTPVSKPDTNLQTTPESPVSSLTDTLEWMFEYSVDRVEATDKTLTIVHHRIGKITVDIDVDFEDIESMLKGLE